jgi:hypothetical protein
MDAEDFRDDMLSFLFLTTSTRIHVNDPGRELLERLAAEGGLFGLVWENPWRPSSVDSDRPAVRAIGRA